MSDNNYPLVSVGLPIYNEERFIRATLSALVNQSYPNLEIIVSNNASTDNTAEICKQYAEQNSVIKLFENEQNLGVSENSRIVLRKSTGKYFMWASGHDLWDAKFIESAVACLEKDTQAVIAFAPNNWIDENSVEMKQCSGWSDTTGLGPCSRLIVTLLGSMNPVLGLIRREGLLQLPKIHGCVGSDLLVLSELSLKGSFATIPTASWSRREFREETQYSEKIDRYQSQEFNLVEGKFHKTFPNINLAIRLMGIILRSHLGLIQKTIMLPSAQLILLIKWIDFKLSNKSRPST